MPRSLILSAALLLGSSCGSERTAPTAEQNQAMNEAGEMLDRAPESLSGIDDSALNQQGAVATNAP